MGVTYVYTDMKRQSGIGTRLVLIFFVMLVVGAVYANLFMLHDNRLLSEFMVHEKNMDLLLEVDWRLLFARTFKMRLLQLTLFLLISHVFNIRLALYGLTALLGAMFGMLVSIETVSLGAIGMCYGVVTWMPQGIFYGIAYYIMVLQARQGGKGLLGQMQNVAYEGYTGHKREIILLVVIKILLWIALIAIGSIAEAYLNPRFILFCNQHLVSVIKL